MTYLYFLLSLRSLYAVMHSGATVALGSGVACVSANAVFFVLFGPAPQARACVPSSLVGDSYRGGLGCLRIMVPAGGRDIEGGRPSSFGETMEGRRGKRTNPD